MYFTTETEAKSLEVGISRTYVATSSDGLWWNNYHILRGAAGIRMPGGTPYNNSNGGVRAFPLQQRGQILLTTDMTGDDTKNADQSEKGHQFILKTSVDEPWTVTEVRAFHKRNNAGNFEEDSLSHCDPGSICDTSTIVSPAVVPAVTIARAGFFWIQNIGIFYSNGGDAFCHVPTMDVYAMMGGTSTNTYQLNSLPTEMRNDADCTVAKAKEGFFWLQNIGIFYSNGTDAFCHVTTMPNYYAMGGNSSNTVQLGSYPTAMRNDGNCQ